VRRRPPRFALVLSVLIAAAGIAVLVLSGSPQSHRGGRQPTVGLGPSHACARSRAAAAVTTHSAIVITATAQAPVRVTEQASGPSGTATVALSETVAGRLRLSQPVSVRRAASAAARACADAGSFTAAHHTALRIAYRHALADAHAVAARRAASSLRSLTHRMYPSVLAHARAKAAARAHRLAVAAAPRLAARAAAEARRRAGA
jgi:hypothetical protein